jgi:uncharacterized protein YciI
MQYFVYGRDRPGGYDLKVKLTEDHWAFMDEYEDALIARGPTLTEDGEETTGSLHIAELPDVEAARAFTYDEPYYRAGVFESVLLCRFRNHLSGTMWDFTETTPGYGRYLVLTKDEARPVSSKHLIAYGDLLSLEDDTHVGRAALVEAPDARAAAVLLEAAEVDVHPWEFGGRRD